VGDGPEKEECVDVSHKFAGCMVEVGLVFGPSDFNLYGVGNGLFSE
jgi:hypothetical protein